MADKLVLQALRATIRARPGSFVASSVRPMLLGMLSSFLPHREPPAAQEALLRGTLLAPNETWGDVEAWRADHRLRGWLRKDALNRW